VQGVRFDDLCVFFLQRLLPFSRGNTYASGVNQLGFGNRGVFYDTNLFTHELGHNMGFSHDSSGSFIMSPSIQNTDVFGPESIVRTRVCDRVCMWEACSVSYTYVCSLALTHTGLQQHLVYNQVLDFSGQLHGKCASDASSVCKRKPESVGDSDANAVPRVESITLADTLADTNADANAVSRVKPITLIVSAIAIANVPAFECNGRKLDECVRQHQLDV
jgi:hypothetical protein